ncbi:unnamed protein product [Dimorphilus gyrociliatus]|uniref:D-aminoacyl-tRNA deacylase n=1 Tax=Dimorphilus gyrociliatus TaxID=2664684 RepID=A0A7I8VCI8_9ANNE|nr:unnamed protein product [Dimorphilus gyrociliatus]
MKALIQRVLNAKVTVNGDVVSEIGKGLCVLVGISRDDNKKDMEFIVRKILNLRVFDDENGKRWAKSAKDLNLEILCVSQFTLYHVLKGNKPDFHNAMTAEQSEKFYNEFLDEMKKNYKPEAIKNGLFGADMQVHIQNDGPVTIDVVSPPKKPARSQVEGASSSKRDDVSSTSEMT